VKRRIEMKSENVDEKRIKGCRKWRKKRMRWQRSGNKKMGRD
jgi:hypothetical protein